MIIKKISIKNFRSIERCKLEFTNINIFSGCNDSGKSNLLKALNLFFNNKTDHDVEFDFAKDFCHFATVPNKTAAEIQIELTLCPPKHYKDNRSVVWRKKWRKDYQQPFDIKLFVPPSPSNKVHKSTKNWIHKLRYRYVPALKGDNYFPHLLKDLHSTLATSIDNELNAASEAFVSTLGKHTLSMTNTLHDQLKLGSKIRLPEDLSGLFEVLDFGTDHNGSIISISRRGDGVKIRHIPSILKFLHDEENRVKKHGELKTNTIWGYEEPENNLELASAFSKSNELFEISNEIQICLTTHSPAFYSLKNKFNEATLYYTTQETTGTRYSPITDNNEYLATDDKMGLLPLVTPYIAEKEKELEETKKQINELASSVSHNENTLFVEGVTDARIINHYLKMSYDEKINVLVKTDNCAGAEWVRNSLIAWAMHPNVENTEYKAFGLLDKDSAGKDAHNNFNSYLEYMGRKAHLGKVKSGLLQPGGHLINILKEDGFHISIAIEELFPSHIWLHAQEQGWLTERDLSKCIGHSLMKNDKTFYDIVVERFPDVDDNIYILNKVSDEFKVMFSKYVTSNRINDFEGTYSLIRKNVDKAIDFFNK